MYKVLKRDGTTAEFDIAKISAAMVKAFEAVGRQHHPTVTNMLALQVTSDFENKIKDGMVISMEAFLSAPMEIAPTGQPFSQGRWVLTMALYWQADIHLPQVIHLLWSMLAR